jgi:hypothetical protein
MTLILPKTDFLKRIFISSHDTGMANAICINDDLMKNSIGFGFGFNIVFALKLKNFLI